MLLPAAFLVFPPGFLWGPHRGSAYEPWSRYLFMLLAMSLAWAILMTRGARDSIAHRDTVDYGILVNPLHRLVMFVQGSLVPARAGAPGRRRAGGDHAGEHPRGY